MSTKDYYRYGLVKLKTSGDYSTPEMQVFWPLLVSQEKSQTFLFRVFSEKRETKMDCFKFFFISVQPLLFSSYSFHSTRYFFTVSNHVIWTLLHFVFLTYFTRICAWMLVLFPYTLHIQTTLYSKLSWYLPFIGAFLKN